MNLPAFLAVALSIQTPLLALVLWRDHKRTRRDPSAMRDLHSQLARQRAWERDAGLTRRGR